MRLTPTRVFLAIFFAGITSSHAQSLQPPPPRPFPLTHTTSAAHAPETTQIPRSSAETPNPPFVMSAPNVRTKEKSPKTGYDIGVWGGVNVVQEGDWKIGGTRVDDKSQAWMGAGVKIGYTWPFNDEPIMQFSDEVGGDGLRLAGGLEGEGFWVGSKLRPNDGIADRTLNIDSSVFMLNFLLKAQAGNFRPYVGPGVGFAAVFSHDYNKPGTTKSDDSAAVFAFQTLAGCDYFLNRDWSIFGEYRFLLFSDVDLYNSPVNFRAEDLNQHLLSFGFRRHF